MMRSSILKHMAGGAGKRLSDRRRLTARAVIVGCIAASAGISVASAVEPYEPNCQQEDPTWDDCGGDPEPSGNDDGPDGNGGAGQGSSDCHGSDGSGFDVLTLSGDGIDFGNSVFAGGVPVGPGSVSWSVPDCDWYTAQLVGTLHLDGVSGQYGRMHVSYSWGGELVAIRHGGVVRAPDNGHEDWSVNMAPYLGANVDEVLVCTELSDNGVDFHAVSCKTRYL